MALKKAVGVVNSSSYSLLGFLGLLGEKYRLDVGQYTTLGDGDTGQKLVQLFVVTDSELKMTGDDPGLLVVTGGVTCQLENLSGQVLHDGSHVHWGTGTYTLRVVSTAEKTVDSSHGKLKSSTAGSALSLGTGLSSFSTSRHDDTELCISKRNVPFTMVIQYLYPSAGS